MEGGAGGIAFDGAPRWASHTCAVCHTGAPAAAIGVTTQADQPELFTDGWKPGMQYHLRVVLENEHAGVHLDASGDNCGFNGDTPYKPCDKNGFALEMTTRRQRRRQVRRASRTTRARDADARAGRRRARHRRRHRDRA